MNRRMLVAAVVLCSLPVFATSVTTFSFNLGTMAENSLDTTLTLFPVSILINVTGKPCTPVCSGILGSVTFVTGALTSGSIENGGTFGPGGMLRVDGNGTNGVPNGVMFQGTFNTAAWVVTKISGVGDVFTLIGQLTGTGKFAGLHASTIQSSILVGSNPFAPGGTGTVASSGGSLTAGVAPEPGTLSLMGTGILGIAAGIRYRQRLLGRQSQHAG